MLLYNYTVMYLPLYIFCHLFMKTSTNAFLDASAMTLSGLCLVHCLLLPVLALFLPFLAVWTQAEWVHFVFAGIAMPLSGFALWHARVRHGLPLIRVFFAILAFAGLLFGAFDWPSEHWGTAITVCCSLMIAFIHLSNFNHRRINRSQ